MTRQSTRRKFLASGAVVSGVALAGCTGDSEPEEEEPADDDMDDGMEDEEPVVEDDSAVELVYSKEQLRTNCGTISHPNDDPEKFYLTAGAPSNRDPDGVGEWYVLDTDSHQPIDPETGEPVEEFETLDVARDVDGYDTHGFWFIETDDGRELWLLNRETDDGVVIDPETDEVIDTVDDYGPAPDIMWSSPDDEHMFVTLRGPNPQSGDPHAAEGETPGVSVLDTETREIITTLEPDPDNDESDFHGIGVADHGEDDYEIWALDQGTDIIYIYEPVEGEEDDDPEFEIVEEIDLHETEGVIEADDYVPHMIDFSSDYGYAAVACTAGGQTLVFDVENHELVEALDTGPSSHFAGFTPDDEQILVDVIADGAIQQITADLDAEEFELGEEIVVLDTAAVEDHDDEFDSANPICHDHAGDYSYHTLGPSVDASGLVVLNWAELGE